MPRRRRARAWPAPRATCAVHSVCGAHDLVVLPALAIGVLPRTVLAGGDAVAVGERLFDLVEEGQAIEKVRHGQLPGRPAFSAPRVRWRRRRLLDARCRTAGRRGG